MESRRARDTAKRHRLNTEDWTMITLQVIPTQIGQYELVSVGHAGGAAICFSRRFKLQQTAALFIPAFLNISFISRKLATNLQRCWKQLVPTVFWGFFFFFLFKYVCYAAVACSPPQL